MNQSTGNSLRHQFLISMPQLADPNFSGTLTYLCEHNEQGAMGLVINRPTSLCLGDVLMHIDITISPGSSHFHDTVFAGGPVDIEHGFILHSRDNRHWNATMPVTDTLSLATSRDILQAIAEGEGPDMALIALGYAGWGAGQLEQEISQNTWLTCPADTDILFNTPIDQRLIKAAAKIGVNLDLLSHEAGHA